MANELRKLFSAFGTGALGGKINLKSNIFGGGSTGSKYSAIGSPGKYGEDSNSQRNSPTVGNAVTNAYLSTYYSKLSEIKSYEYCDVSEMIVSVFRDYIINFMNKTGDIVTIKNEEGDIDSQKTIRINNSLVNDLKLSEVIKEHLPEIVYYGGYHFMIEKTRDDTGHIKLIKKDLYDPVVVISRTKDKDKTVYICKGDDGKIYEVPYEEVAKLGCTSIRLKNDMDEDGGWVNPKRKDKEKSNREKIQVDELYTGLKPMYYSITHKVKEYLLKDIIISLLSIKDLVQPLLLSMHFDKGTPLENADKVTKKVEAIINNYSDLSSVLTAQFGITDIIDALMNNVKIIPDYSSSAANMGTVELNKINQKIQEIRMELDNCRDNVLETMGLSSDLYNNRLSKWDALKTSERLNSRINSYISGLKSSIQEICRVISLNIYEEDLDINSVEVHLFSRTTTEYNIMTNSAEVIGGLIQQMSTILEFGLRTLEIAGPLFDQQSYLEYLTTTLKNIDPNMETFTSKESIKEYIDMLRAKQQAAMMNGDEMYQ